MDALASPTNFPNETFSSGERVPKERDAPEIDDLSPVWSKRALFNSSRVAQALKAESAESTQP